MSSLQFVNWVFLFLVLVCLCGCKPPTETTQSASVVTNAPTLQNDPIVVRYVDLQTDKKMSARDRSYFVSRSSKTGPLFWVTNRGEKPIVIQLSLETLVNEVWTSNTTSFSLRFHTEEKTTNGGKTSFTRKELSMLPPHQTAYAATVDYGGNSPRLILPLTNSWRVKASVQEQLNGVRRTVAAVKHYPTISKLPGNTNLLAPFATNVSYFGQPIEVYSDKVDPFDDGLK